MFLTYLFQENDNGLKSHRPKNVTIKKVKTKSNFTDVKSKPNLIEVKTIPLKLTDKITLKQNVPQPAVVRVPQNNNTKQNITVIHGLKKQPLTSNSNTPSKSLLLPLRPSKTPSLATKVDVIEISPPTNNKTVPSVSNENASRPVKRINPKKISDSIVSHRASSIEKSSDSDMLSRDSSVAANDETTIASQNQANGTNKPKENDEPTSKRQKMVNNEQPSIDDDYRELLKTCKAIEKSSDMDKVIEKLQKYYRRAHPDYVKSKSFHKLVKRTTNEIKETPTLLYMKITNLSDELKTRRTMGDAGAASTATTIPTSENSVEPEADKKTRKRVSQLSEALHKLRKKILKLEVAEVDLDDEYNSNYLLTERYKKRAYEIYSKICELTGESRNAERIIKKPIKFRGTAYPEFNRRLEKFVNVSKSFPDMFDVQRIMNQSNIDYNYRMSDTLRISVGKNEKIHSVFYRTNWN